MGRVESRERDLTRLPPDFYSTQTSFLFSTRPKPPSCFLPNPNLPPFFLPDPNLLPIFDPTQIYLKQTSNQTGKTISNDM